MSAIHGDASACQVGNYLHGCDSSELTSQRSLCAASRHGDQIAYDTYRCRCPDARTAHRIGRGRRHLRLLRSGPALVPSVGTARRLQALAAIGYSVEDLATGLGIRDSYVGKLQHATSRRVRRVTAEKVCAFYQKHADQRGPSPHAIPYAARNGWRSPIWWDDDTIDDPVTQAGNADNTQIVIDSIAIERCVAGDTTVALTRTEKGEAYQAFRARGVSHNQAAIRLKLSGSTAKKLARIVDVRTEVVGVREDRGANDTRSAAS